MELAEKITLVKNEILTRFPDCHYTVITTQWNDGTDCVECRHGTKEGTVYTATYYANKLTFYEENVIPGSLMLKTEDGKYVYVMPDSEFDEYFGKDRRKKTA